jgi:hypothetical protein
MRSCANYQLSVLSRALLAVVLALVTGGCNTSANSNATSTRSDDKSTTAAGGRIDMNCVGNHVQSPPDAFHYSYKSTDGGSVDKEADVTPQNIDMIIQNQFGSHKYHGVRSDEDSWNSAVLNLSGSGFTVMSARISFVAANTSVARAGAEAMNGYQTTKYSIDTTSANSSDSHSYETLFGPGSYEKGTIWVTADGCPVKLTLDEGRHQGNGSVDKLRYEIDVIKK